MGVQPAQCIGGRGCEDVADWDLLNPLDWHTHLWLRYARYGRGGKIHAALALLYVLCDYLYANVNMDMRWVDFISMGVVGCKPNGV